VKPIRYEKAAAKFLTRMQRPIARRIREKIEQWVAEPASLDRNVTEMKGRPGVVRLRVGDHRVLIRETEGEVQILDIGPRGGIYD
jgi:mRNA interferase RelE/StbE